MDDFDDLLHELEIKNGRIWVIDVLLSIKPRDVNDKDDKSDYIHSMSVLKYIGTTEQFRKKFTKWFNNYEINSLGNEMYERVLKDFIDKVSQYMPYIPECLKVYKILKSLKPIDYQDDFDVIDQPMFMITQYD